MNIPDHVRTFAEHLTAIYPASDFIWHILWRPNGDSPHDITWCSNYPNNEEHDLDNPLYCRLVVERDPDPEDPDDETDNYYWNWNVSLLKDVIRDPTPSLHSTWS